MKKLKIGYFADGRWAHNAFSLIDLDERFSIEFICLRFDTCDEILAEFGRNQGIDIIKHKNVNSADFLHDVEKYQCDIFVSMSFNQILKSNFINFPPKKTINCHAGKLPFYRGRNILNWVLINDEKEFGVTVHYVDEGIDTGDIILQETFPITQEDSYKTLLEKAFVECAKVLHKALVIIFNDQVIPIPQSDIHPVGFYCTQRKTGDEFIDWTQNSREIFNFVRAICAPGPMARAFCNGYEIKINKVSLIENAPSYKMIPGIVVGRTGEYLIIKTGDTTILVEEYVTEKKIKIGDRFN